MEKRKTHVHRIESLSFLMYSKSTSHSFCINTSNRQILFLGGTVGCVTIGGSIGSYSLEISLWRYCCAAAGGGHGCGGAAAAADGSCGGGGGCRWCCSAYTVKAACESSAPRVRPWCRLLGCVYRSDTWRSIWSLLLVVLPWGKVRCRCKTADTTCFRRARTCSWKAPLFLGQYSSRPRKQYTEDADAEDDDEDDDGELLL